MVAELLSIQRALRTLIICALQTSLSGIMRINKELSGSMELPLPAKFSGKYEDWEDWSWTFKTYMNMMEPTLAPYMDKVQDMPLEITDDDLKEKDNEALSKARITFSRAETIFLLSGISAAI